MTRKISQRRERRGDEYYRKLRERGVRKSPRKERTESPEKRTTGLE